ncbi:MAG TPA: GDSL-type esterase/lipase family protein [Planctomycetota bacterium]|nr:GDSL-type esterase/lipase family protein [Planctomycetota bacterium]
MKRPLQKIALAATATLLCLAFAEVALRVLNLAPEPRRRDAWTASTEPGAPPPLHVLTDSPELYVLNPAHPEVSAQGFRSELVAVPKPAGVFRILMLGDSVAYGHAVSREAAFPFQLQQLLRAGSRSIEVVNAGVTGYTAYNELQAYLVHGRQLEPDLVVIALCLNDVVNPRLHWGATAGQLLAVPEEAIPNEQYDRDVILPRIQAATKLDLDALTLRHRTFADNFALYRFVRARTSGWGRQPALATGEPAGNDANRPNVPTLLTGDDTISIEVLLSRDSAERRWLDAIYRQLRTAVEADGARFAVAILPLSYQIDADYPFLPQTDLAECFAAEGVPCLDLLPALRQYPKEEVFMLTRAGFYDVWHLTEAGHVVVAKALAQFLEQQRLLTGRH